jgi:hypothetical protein
MAVNEVNIAANGFIQQGQGRPLAMALGHRVQGGRVVLCQFEDHASVSPSAAAISTSGDRHRPILRSALPIVKPASSG